MRDARALRARAANRPGLVKASPGDWSKRWARDAYHGAVLEAGGYSAVGAREGRDESTVRDRCFDERQDPRLSSCRAGLDADGLRALADVLLDAADEEESRRRAG